MTETSKALKQKATLEEKKKEALKASKPEWKTSGEFRPNMYNERGFVNIKHANRQQVLAVYRDMKNYSECAKELQFDGKHLGFTAEEWMEDCLTRSAVIRMSETLAAIAGLENHLRERLLSEEELKEIELTEMDEAIAKL